MIRFIGGLSRTGKSTFGAQIARRDGLRLETDWLSARKPLHPDISGNPWDDQFNAWARLSVDYENRAWDAVSTYIGSAVEEEADLTVIGSSQPGHVLTYPCDFEYRAVFFVDTKMSEHIVDDVFDRIGSPMSGWTSDEVRQWGRFIDRRSETIIRLGESLGAHIFDIGKMGMNDAQSHAATVMGY